MEFVKYVLFLFRLNDEFKNLSLARWMKNSLRKAKIWLTDESQKHREQWRSRERNR